MYAVQLKKPEKNVHTRKTPDELERAKLSRKLERSTGFIMARFQVYVNPWL